MQGITKALRLHGRQLRHAVQQHMNKGIFKAKGEAEAGAVYWCDASNLVHEAVKHVSIYVLEYKCRTDDLFLYFSYI
jgi:hypothetical protein